MTDDEVVAEAFGARFELCGRVVGGDWVWGWVRGEDDRWPCFLERRLALDWMRDRLNRIRVFA